MVNSWVAKPTISTLTPMFLVFPCQLFELAMPDPETWMRKEKMSQPTNIFVILVADMWKIFGIGVESLEGRTLSNKRPRRR